MHREVDPAAVQAFDLSIHTFELEPKSFGDRPASIVVGGHVQLDSVESQIEEVINHGRAGPGL